MITPRRAKTLGEDVFARVRADVLAGRLAPGERLKLVELSSTLGASVAIVREALIRLAGQGLVVSEPQLGFRVTPLSAADLRELTELRSNVEGTALRQAVEHGDIAWEAGIVAAHHTLGCTAIIDPGDPERLADEWTAAHAAFHGALIAACPNRRLRELATSLRDATELYRSWSLPLGGDHDRDVPAEHRALTDACVAREPARAEVLLIDHIWRTTDAVLRLHADVLAPPL